MHWIKLVLGLLLGGGTVVSLIFLYEKYKNGELSGGSLSDPVIQIVYASLLFSFAFIFFILTIRMNRKK